MQQLAVYDTKILSLSSSCNSDRAREGAAPSSSGKSAQPCVARQTLREIARRQIHGNRHVERQRLKSMT